MQVVLTSAIVLGVVCLTHGCYKLTDSKHYIMNIDEETETFDVACFLKGKRIELGEQVVDKKHCRKCNCGFGGMECCGYGSKGGISNTEIPEGCKMVKRKCFNKLVRIDDESQPCDIIKREAIRK